jgi:hypothetical protein
MALLALTIVGLIVGGGAASAQLQSGNLYGKASDQDGAALPGVTITLKGGAGAQVQVTDEQGQFRFLGLDPGAYSLEATLDGFSTVNHPSLTVNVGRNTTIDLVLQAAITDTITITSESPLLDARKITAGNTVDKLEMEKIPTARDPWAVLQSTPGVLTDRINVGGNESGQQALYVGPGAQCDQSTWALDGVTITDMSATGSSPGYYDFDSFEEMQVSTGGSDITQMAPGVALNMVTKRGTNEWRGTARYLVSDDGSQSDLDFDEGDLGKAGPWNNNAGQSSFKQGNRISKVEDWGFEIGGPVVRDRAWIWGSYAKPKIDLLTVSDFQDLSTLEETNVKLNAQLMPQNSLAVSGWQSDKVKLGRNAGPLRPQETTWNQSKFGPDPTSWKVEDTHVFGPSFLLTGMVSEVNGGFVLAPHIAGNTKIAFQDADGVFHLNSPANIEILRPQEQAKLDGSTFFNTGSWAHELKFGAGYREAEQTSLSQTISGAVELDAGDGQSQYVLARDARINVRTDYTSLYAQDTLALGNLTANIGVRYDKQGGENLATRVAANAFRPDLLPAASTPASDAGFEWTSIVPRLGVTYALGQNRSTLLRASYSQYADQLATGFAGQLQALGAQAYAYFYGPQRANGTLNPADLVDFAGLTGNVHPITHGALISNAVDPDLDAPLTQELIVGIEHALLPEFVIGLQGTFRHTTDLLEQERLVFDGDAYSAANLTQTGRVHRRSDYVPVVGPERTRPDGSKYHLQYWELKNGVTTRDGFRLENGDREWNYKGVALTLNKRLANRWMMRGSVSFNDWTWDSPESENEDPTLALPNGIGAIQDGEDVIQSSGTGSGSKGNVYIQSKWQYSLNAMYQVAPDRPWGFNVAANLTGREGYPQIYFERVFRSTIGDGPTGINVPVVDDLADYRLDDVQMIDLRLEKEFVVRDIGFTVGADLFNATNESFVLQRNGRLRRANSDHVLEIVSPRVVRFGVRLSLR